jgi:hypothetical protein
LRRKPADRGTGVVFRDPANPKYNSIRIMNGNPNATYKVSQGPYIRVFRNGSYVDDAGNKDPNANTPLKGNPAL